MRYSTIAGAALLAPTAFASPLNARQAGVPTCNPNNIRALGQQKPKSTGFCTNWFKTTTTQHVAPVTVTGLSEAQITNLCSCILAPTYVSGRPLTSLEPTSTQGSTTPAITSSVASSTTSSSGPSATPTGCVTGDTPAGADGAIFTKYCDSGLDGGVGQGFSVGSLANCQAKCTDSCKGFVYTASSRSCLLYTSVDGPYDSTGSTALVYKSGRGSSSSSSAASSTSASSSLSSSVASSSSSSAVSSTTSGPASVPSVFNIYIATSAGATASGSLLRYPASTLPAGIYPSPTPNVMKRQAACSTENYSSNGNTYKRQCDAAFGTTAASGSTPGDTTALAPADQPDKDDNITTLAGCIDLCAKKGVDVNGKQNCKAASFDPAGVTASANTACQLYSAVKTSAIATTGNTGKSLAYLIGDVPAGIFTLDPNTGYVYNNDTSSTGGTQLCGQPTGSTDSTTGTVIDANSVINGKLGANCVPLQCKVDSQLRLSCSFSSNNIIYDKPALNPADSVAVGSTTARIQALKLTTGASSSISMYIAAPIASISTPSVYSNGAEKNLLTATDLVNSNAKTTTGKSFVNLTPAGSLNLTYALDADATSPNVITAPVTLFKDVFVYAQDTYRFTASVSLDKGRLLAGVTCMAQFGFDIDQTVAAATRYTKKVTLGQTFPATFDLLFEGTFPNTKTTTASFDVTCSTGTTGPAITIPITVSNLKLVNNPTVPARATYEIVGSSSSSYKAYAQFFSGSGSLIPDGNTYNGAATTAVGGVTATGPTVLYVGQSTSNQAAAIKACAASAGSNLMFEVYFDTTDSYWKCTLISASLPSKTLFGAGYAPAVANANPVYGYYLSSIIPYSA